MKVIYEPKVTIVAHSHFLEHPTYKVPKDGEELVRLGAFAAKGCYDSYGEDGRSCVKNQQQILEHRHGSVLEHCYATLFIEGISRALTLEMNRHRLLNISQRSTRYTKEEDSAIVLEPFYADLWKRYRMRWDDEQADLFMENKLLWHPCLATVDGFVRYEKDVELIRQFIYACSDAIEGYTDQVELLERLNPNNLKGFELRKWARGKARNILPHALETRVTYTANIRAWRWFVESRSDRHAEPEIRRLAVYVLKELRNLAPTYFEDFRQTEIVDGIPEFKPQYSKV